MTPEIDNLLAVLDMKEEEQRLWIIGEYYKNPDNPDIISLADLAFHKRDEAVEKYGVSPWRRAVNKISIKCATSTAYCSWWDEHSKPIHWIIAAEIAKGSK